MYVVERQRARIMILAREIFKRFNSKAIYPDSWEPGNQIYRPQLRETSAFITYDVTKAFGLHLLAPLSSCPATCTQTHGVTCPALFAGVSGQPVRSAQPIWPLGFA